MPVTIGMPSEGIFRGKNTDTPEFFIRSGGRIIPVDLTQYQQGATTHGAATQAGLKSFLQTIGITPEQYQQLPQFSSADFITSPQLREEFLAGQQVERNKSVIERSVAPLVQKPAQVVQQTFQTPTPSAGQSVFNQPSPPQNDLRSRVEQTASGLKANKEFVNATFKAYHGRDANAKELQTFTGKSVEEVRNLIGAGARTVGLPTAPQEPTPINVDPITGQPFAPSVFGPQRGPTIGATTGTSLKEESSAGTPDNTDPKILPKEIQDDHEFISLDEKSKGLVAYAWKMNQQNDVLKKIQMKQALASAIKIAEPIFKQKMLDVQDAADRSIKELLASSKFQVEKMQTEIANLQTNGKLADARDLSVVLENAQRESSSREAEVGATIARLQERIQGIQTDLEYNKGQLTIEEQSSLNQTANQYKAQLKDTQQNAVDAGMGFSSIRAEAEQRLTQQSQDIVESTKRQTARQIREQETTATQQKAELNFAQAETQRKAEEARIANARKVEQLIGSDEAVKQGILTPDLKSLGLKGSIAEQKTQREQEAAARQASIDELNRRTTEEKAAQEAKKAEDLRLTELQRQQYITQLENQSLSSIPKI